MTQSPQPPESESVPDHDAGASAPTGAPAASTTAAATAGTSTTTKILAALVAVAVVLLGAGAFWWFSVRRANAVYLAAAATAEAQTVAATVHVEIDDETLRSLSSDGDLELTSQDVADVGLRFQRQVTDQQSEQAWLPAGAWSTSITYRGAPVATAGLTEQTGSPVLAALLDPDGIDAAIARLTGSTDVTVAGLADDAMGSVPADVEPYLRDLLAGKSVGVDLGPGSFLASAIEEGLAASAGDASGGAEQELLQDVWDRLRDRLPEAVTMTETGADEAGTRYTVAIDVPRVAALLGDALGQACAEQQNLTEESREACRSAADELAQWDGEGAPASLQLEVWLRDDRLSRVAFDVAQTIRDAGGAADVPADAVVRVVVDLAYDLPPFDFADLVVVPDDVVRKYVEDSQDPGLLAG